MRVLDLTVRILFLLITVLDCWTFIVSFVISKDISNIIKMIKICSIVSAFYFMACVPIPGKKLEELEKEKALNTRLEPVDTQT